MQSVVSGWTAEERDTVRRIAHNLRVSWKKDSILGNRTFTIGVSTIGGNDVIGINPGAIGSPGNYRYFDESNYVTELAWERGLNMPTGGISKAMAEATLDNTSGRFIPRYMGGHSELYTSILPRRPMIISGGLRINGVDITLPQFAGVLTNQPAIDTGSKEVKLQMADYMDFFENRFVDRSAVFTSVTTDVVIESLFSQLGMSTAQYHLDPGINVIPFGVIDKGASLKNVISKLVESENGQLYQREDGVIVFENRQHWDSSPYTQIQRIINTSQVINALAPSEDHIINVVEVKSQRREKAINQMIWSMASPQLIPANGTLEIFADFSDEIGSLPVLAVDTPVYYATGGSLTSAFATNVLEDDTGATNDGFISLQSYSQFTTSYKMVFQNSSATPTFLTKLDLWGRPAKSTGEIYVRRERDASVTAYEERPLTIENEFIQSEDWAESLAEMILEDFSRVENLQNITIRALPELQLGDLISWQGRYWRVYDIKSKLDPGNGFIQELSLLQRTIRQYFRIGISTIGGTDKIAP